MRLRGWFLLILTLGFGYAQGQQLQPEGRFLSDSLRIGEEIPYSLSVTYPIEEEVVFPDSNYNYAPFEFVRKEYFVSNADDATITDSVIYHLASFEIDPAQGLSLPIFLLSDGDSTMFLSNIDSVYLIEMVPVMPDSVALREDTSYVEVSQAINYPYLIIGLGVLLILVVIVYFAFGDQIRKKIRLYRMEKAYKKFTDDFDLLFADLQRKEDKTDSEKLLIIWKKYMEGLEDRPYTKLTSREISALTDAGKLKGALRNIDKTIYGSLAMDQIAKSFEELEDITSERYQRKILEVKNG